MGRLAVLSALGHPLLAEIELLGVGKADLPGLSVRLAPREAYQQAGLQHGAALMGLRLSIERRPNGEPYVKVMSLRPVNEPFVELLIELNTASERLLRQYTVLIDPPGYTPAETIAATAPAVDPRVASPPPVAPAPAPPAAPKAAAGSKYGPVKRGETLSKIAAAVKPEEISLDQMLVALLRSNPHAFINHNMNLIKAGVTLNVPEKSELAAVSQSEAQDEVRLQARNWRQYRRKLADQATEVSKHRAEAPAARRVKVEDKDDAGKEGKPVLKLSTGVPPGKTGKGRPAKERLQELEEELVAREKALKEANQRIQELERAVKEATAK
jgi:pilus assembly protein FimV